MTLPLDDNFLCLFSLPSGVSALDVFLIEDIVRTLVDREKCSISKMCPNHETAALEKSPASEQFLSHQTAEHVNSLISEYDQTDEHEKPISEKYPSPETARCSWYENSTNQCAESSEASLSPVIATWRDDETCCQQISPLRKNIFEMESFLSPIIFDTEDDINYNTYVALQPENIFLDINEDEILKANTSMEVNALEISYDYTSRRTTSFEKKNYIMQPLVIKESTTKKTWMISHNTALSSIKSIKSPTTTTTDDVFNNWINVRFI